MRIVEVNPDIVRPDIVRRQEFQSVTLGYSAQYHLRHLESIGEIRGAIRSSKLPADWRAQWEGKSLREFLYDDRFRSFARGLDKYSYTDLMWQIFQEDLWPAIQGPPPEF